MLRAGDWGSVCEVAKLWSPRSSWKEWFEQPFVFSRTVRLVSLSVVGVGRRRESDTNTFDKLLVISLSGRALRP